MAWTNGLGWDGGPLVTPEMLNENMRSNVALQRPARQQVEIRFPDGTTWVGEVCSFTYDRAYLELICYLDDRTMWGVLADRFIGSSLVNVRLTQGEFTCALRSVTINSSLGETATVNLSLRVSEDRRPTIRPELDITTFEDREQRSMPMPDFTPLETEEQYQRRKKVETRAALDKTAADLLRDYDLLVKSGIAEGTVLLRMARACSEYFLAERRSGGFASDAMLELARKLAEAGFVNERGELLVALAPRRDAAEAARSAARQLLSEGRGRAARKTRPAATGVPLLESPERVIDLGRRDDE